MAGVTKNVNFAWLSLIMVLASIAVGTVYGYFLGKMVERGMLSDTLSVVSTERRDTVYLSVRDTMPVIRSERVLCYVPLDSVVVSADSVGIRVDSFPVVQRVYSDDSTYTAFVSGLRYGGYPCLDSINVRMRSVTQMVERTVTLREKSGRWSVGIQAGYGYGVLYKGFEPYVGVGVTCRLW